MAKKKNPPPGPESAPTPRPVTARRNPPPRRPETSAAAAQGDPSTQEAGGQEAGPAQDRRGPGSGSRPTRCVPGRWTWLSRRARSFDPKRRTTLAKEAIKLNPDCAEAYLLLAEQSKNRKAALGLFEQAVAAAERALGPETVRRGGGPLLGSARNPPLHAGPRGAGRGVLGVGATRGGRRPPGRHAPAQPRRQPGLALPPGRLAPEPRPARRARRPARTVRRGLGDLELHPGPGVVPDRGRLARGAQALASRPEVEQACDRLPDRPENPARPSRPPTTRPGGEDDAVLYVANHLGAWKSTPGSLTWVRSATSAQEAQVQASKAAEGPSVAAEQRLLELPAEVDTWQADFRQFARRIEVGGERIRPWMVLVSSRSRELVLGHAMVEQEPTADSLWDIIAGAMEHPAMGDPHRPTEIQVRADSTWEALEAPSKRSASPAPRPTRSTRSTSCSRTWPSTSKGSSNPACSTCRA